MSDDRDSTGEQHGRDETGRWISGRSGNPAGRPKGARHKATMAAEALLDDAAERLSTKAIELALSGDTVALRLCLERVLLPRKDRTLEVDLPSIETTSDLTKATSRLLAATASGELTPTEAAELGKIVEGHRRCVELTELEKRIRELEEQSGTAGS